MKPFCLLLLASFLPAADRPPANPVVVELFTSEGCSSCPPADKLLATLASSNPNVIVLSEHVDYWNRLGWRDPFSSAVYSKRQSEYADKFGSDSVYTPEFVVDGRESHDVRSSIAKGAGETKAQVDLTRDSSGVIVNVSHLPSAADADVLLAVTEDNLSSNVTRGENSGRRLDHTGVVRELRVLGRTQGGQYSAHVAAAQGANKKTVVFVQDRTTKRILGASQL